jgi:hypothetical protein
MSSIPITPEVLEDLAKCLIASVVEEGLKDFAKRGWSVRDPDGGADFPKSWSYRIRGGSTIEIQSTWYGMVELASGDIPSRRMTWMTQKHKEDHPEKFKLTKGERERGMKQSGKISKGERLPLVVPLKQKGGGVVLRFAPFETRDAWIHPGIAKFTFMQRGIRKGRERCAQRLTQEVVKHLLQGDPTQ